MSATRALAALATVLIFATPAAAVTIHDESFDGDLSGAFGAPDPLGLSLGLNTVIGQMGDNGGSGATNGNDADYFSLTVGAGVQLTSITVDSYTFSPGDPGASFFGYTAGGAFSGQGAGDIDGFVLFNAASGEILDDLVVGALGSGTWSFWIQETSGNAVDYAITFTTQSVPEPGAGALLALAIGLGALARRRRV